MRQLLIYITCLFSTFAQCAIPECHNPDNWAPSVAYGALKEKQLITSENYDPKTTQVTLLGSKKIGKDLYTLIHKVDFYPIGGKKIVVITKSDASSEECSMSPVKIFLVNELE
ncbi:hypothetical protein [Agarivorans gilvus]|uniref:Tissue inhibitor of metalloproteinase n=1 Tax=Agarivorans gilvus TaxID=680279 RepID=A0ABQ1I8C3_9ALTE|nr:hypothetical protein [Agarivorans gilvus]GGB22354.1 hypothetical protein GCM10007414_39630 [Agarivorans gilvus]